MGGGARILIVGRYGGLHTALRLERLLRPGEAPMVIVNPRAYMTYQPLLAEVTAGNLEPRHLVIPLNGVLRRTQVIKAAVSSIDHLRRTAHLTTGDGGGPVSYDILILAPGSISCVLPVSGLTETGIGFKSIGEAIHRRNHVLERLDVAASASSVDARCAALTFVFAGGGYAGVEALAELQDMAFAACARYPEISHREMRWILVEAADRILPEVSPAMADSTSACSAADCGALYVPTTGSVTSLGLYRRVAEDCGLRMRGLPARMTRRTYHHLLKLPTMNRRLRVIAGGTLARLSPREVISLNMLEHPRRDFQAALDVIATGPSRVTLFRVRNRKNGSGAERS